MISDTRLNELRAIVADSEDYDARRAREARAMAELLAETERLREAIPYTESHLMRLVTRIRELVAPEHAPQPDSSSERIMAWCKGHAGGKYTAGDGEIERRLRAAYLEGYLYQRNTIDARIGQAVTEWRGEGR